MMYSINISYLKISKKMRDTHGGMSRAKKVVEVYRGLREKLNALIFENLIDHSTFALFWHTYAKHVGQSWSHISLTDDTFTVIAFLKALAGCNEDWGDAGVFITLYFWQCVAVETIHAFFQPVEDVAAFWAAGAEVDGVFVAHGDCDDALAVLSDSCRGRR